MEASPKISSTLASSDVFPEVSPEAPIVLDVPDSVVEVSPEKFSGDFNSTDSANSDSPSEDSWCGLRLLGTILT